MSEMSPEGVPEPAVPEFHRGGLIKGPDGEDSARPWFEWFDPRYEEILTAEEIRRRVAAAGFGPVPERIEVTADFCQCAACRAERCES